MRSAKCTKKRLTGIRLYVSSYRCIATHYPLLKTLVDDTSFANYHVSVEKRNGKLYYPFKLSAGVSDQCIALDILQEEGFESDIVDTARSILDR